MNRQEIARHAPEFMGALRSNQYERVDAGTIYFPKQRVNASGLYIIGVNGKELERCPNLLPTEGLNLMLDNIGNNTAIAAAYIALYANALTPIAAHTASGFSSTYSEIVSGAEGYTQSTRVLWNTDAASAAAVNNYSNPAVFTIITASTLSVNGVALLTASAKSSTSGALISASRFSATRSFSNTDEFDVKYQISLTSS